MIDPEFTDPRTHTWTEDIRLALYCIKGHEPHEDITAEAWERAERAVRGVFQEYGWDIRVEQEREWAPPPPTRR